MELFPEKCTSHQFTQNTFAAGSETHTPIEKFCSERSLASPPVSLSPSTLFSTNHHRTAGKKWFRKIKQKKIIRILMHQPLEERIKCLGFCHLEKRYSKVLCSNAHYRERFVFLFHATRSRGHPGKRVVDSGQRKRSASSPPGSCLLPSQSPGPS